MSILWASNFINASSSRSDEQGHRRHLRHEGPAPCRPPCCSAVVPVCAMGQGSGPCMTRAAVSCRHWHAGRRAVPPMDRAVGRAVGRATGPWAFGNL
jgi:hypothetical protein